MFDILNELNEMAGDPERDAIERIAEDLTAQKENFEKFRKLFATFIQSTDKRFDALATQIDILKSAKGDIKIDASTNENNQTNESGSIGTQAQEGDNKQN